LLASVIEEYIQYYTGYDEHTNIIIDKIFNYPSCLKNSVHQILCIVCHPDRPEIFIEKIDEYSKNGKMDDITIKDEISNTHFIHDLQIGIRDDEIQTQPKQELGYTDNEDPFHNRRGFLQQHLIDLLIR
jgi:hypothetical protein